MITCYDNKKDYNGYRMRVNNNRGGDKIDTL